MSRPRPKSDPPRPPMGADYSDETIDKWGKEYDDWAKENNHLPNLQKSSVIIERIKKQKELQNQQKPSSGNTNVSPDLEARFQRIEQKMDKLIKHLGVK